MKKAITVQAVIFIAAFFAMTPDVMQDNTHLFGLIGDVEVVKGNTVWVMLAAMFMSAINLWFWWPKTPVASTLSEAEGTKSTDAKTEEVKAAVAEDPAVPKMD